MANFQLFTSTFTPGYINVSVPDAMLISLLIYLVCRLTFYRKKSAAKKKWLGFMFVYVGAVVALTLFPLRSVSSLPTILQNFWYHVTSVQYMPFATIGTMIKNGTSSGRYVLMMYNLGGNLLMLMPLALLYPKLRGSVKWGKMFTTALTVSLAIEVSQLCANILGICSRNVNIDDMILNVFGCMLAFFICRLFKWVK